METKIIPRVIHLVVISRFNEFNKFLFVGKPNFLFLQKGVVPRTNSNEGIHLQCRFRRILLRMFYVDRLLFLC